MTTPARYWREIPQRYRLEAGQCKKCEKIFFPPRLICDSCGGREFATVNLPDEGRLVTWTVIRVAPTGFTDEVPYTLGIVELSNGVKLTSQLVDVEPENISTGMDVRIEFRKLQTMGHEGLLCYGYKAVPA